MTTVPRVVVVTRPTAYEELLARHATRSQAEFFLKQRGENLAAVEAVHHQILGAVATIQAAIPLDFRRNLVPRDQLDRFLFEPEDIVVVVGQDGLVANVAKYLNGQAVLGVNPTPRLFDGVLVHHSPERGGKLLRAVVADDVRVEERTMVQARLDDGQCLVALNEVFLGQRTHQSARYDIVASGERAHHSSSGVIVSTGTGATGWARSIHRERRELLALPQPNEARLAFFVREAFPSVASSTELTQGIVAADESVCVTSRMEDGVIFGDGMEADFLRFGWGTTVRIRVAEQRLRLVA